MLRELGSSRSRTCAECGAGGFEFSYCTECQKALCKLCTEQHGCGLEDEMGLGDEEMMDIDMTPSGEEIDISGEEELPLPLGEDVGDEWRFGAGEESAEPEVKPLSQHKYFEEYAEFREELDGLLRTSGFKDYEIFGAGGEGEELSPAEYSGALRVVGPAKPFLRDRFVKTVTQFALDKGFKVVEDRPPSITHLFGMPARGMKQYEDPGIERGLKGRHISGQRKEPHSIKTRPFLYIYKSYSFKMPFRHEIDAAREAGLMQHEVPEKGYRMYEDRINQIAGDITEDPSMFDDVPLGERVAREIGKESSFKLLREEMQDASENNIDLQRALHAPVKINDIKVMAHVLAEAKNGQVYIDLVAPVSSDIIKEALDFLSDMMLR